MSKVPECCGLACDSCRLRRHVFAARGRNRGVLRSTGSGANAAPSLQIVFVNDAYETYAVDYNGVAYGGPSNSVNEIWRSTDEGRTWTQRTVFPSDYRVWYLTPLHSGAILAAIDNGSYAHLAVGGRWVNVVEGADVADLTVLATRRSRRTTSPKATAMSSSARTTTVPTVRTRITSTARPMTGGRGRRSIRPRLTGTTTGCSTTRGRTRSMPCTATSRAPSTARPTTASPGSRSARRTTTASGSISRSATASGSTEPTRRSSRTTSSGSTSPPARQHEFMRFHASPTPHMRSAARQFLVGQVHEPGAPVGDGLLHLYASDDGGQSFTDVYQSSFNDNGPDYLQVQFSYPNGDFPIQGGSGTVVAHLSTSAPSPPRNGLPAMSGSTQQGQTLSASNGTWTGIRPRSRIAGATAIHAATRAWTSRARRASTYLLQAADVGRTRCGSW